MTAHPPEKDDAIHPQTPSPSPPQGLIQGVPASTWLTITDRAQSLQALITLSSTCRSLRSLLWPPPSPLLASLLVNSDFYNKSADLALLGIIKSASPHLGGASNIVQPSIPGLIQALTSPPHCADIHFYGDACLRHAVRALSLEVVAELVARGADAGVDESEPLFEAVRRRRMEVLEVLVRCHAPARIWDREWGVLGVAFEGGDEEVLLAVLRGVGVDEVGEKGWVDAKAIVEVMTGVARKGWGKAFEKMLELTVDAKGDEGKVTVLLEASLLACCDAAIALAEPEQEHASPLVQSPASSSDRPKPQALLEILTLLLDTNKVSSTLNDHAPLRASASLGSLPLVTRLTSSLPIINPSFITIDIKTLTIDPDEMQPIESDAVEYLVQDGPHRACDDQAIRLASAMGHMEVVKRLLEVGCDAEAAECEAIVGACAAGNLETVALLLVPYCKNLGGGRYAPTPLTVDVLSSQDFAPLRNAAYTSSTHLLRLLLRLGADVHALDDDALSRAVLGGQLENVKVLLGYGADPSARGKRCLRDARRLGVKEIVDCLEEAVVGRAEKGRRRRVGREGGRLSGLWGHARVVAVDGVDVGGAKNGEGA
ncbi:hypothetical protein HDU67_006203 [Dinochytrium kinnereticum]|nr:hypothetical protein HDU67_006203 [Dinochytrium kinnereticum]